MKSRASRCLDGQLTGATSSAPDDFAGGRCVDPGEANGWDCASAKGDKGSDHSEETLEPDLLLRWRDAR